MPTFTIGVKSKDLSDAIKSIDVWDGKARLRVEAALKKGTQQVQRGAAQRAAVRSGALKKSIKTKFSTTKLQGQVFSTKMYAHFVEYGAKAVTIYPDKKKVLKTENGYSKVVHIPRRTPHPFMRPAYDYAVGDIVKNVEKAVKK